MVFFLVIIAALAFVADAYFSGGGPGIVFWGVLIGAIVYVIIQYYASGSQALAMAGAKPITKADNPRLYRIVENLAITTGLPMPKVYLVDDPAPNAFATGRDPEHAAVAATTGLLEIMDDAELEGVMAHEIAHVKNFDIRVTTIVFGLVVVVGLLADVLARMAFFGGMRRNGGGGNPLMIVIAIAAMILAPLLAAVIQAAVSPTRVSCRCHGRSHHPSPGSARQRATQTRGIRQAVEETASVDGSPLDGRPHQARCH